MRLHNPYDSHVHWLYTGERSDTLALRSLKSVDSVIDLKPNSGRGEWVTGFGWDHYLWPEQELPNRKSLDRWLATRPVCFTRVDGHAVWVNSKALQLAGITADTPNPSGGLIVRDAHGQPTGVLIDHAMALVQAHIPPPSAHSLRRSLLDGVRYFNQRGFTHIRDLSCDEEQWHEKVHLAESGELTLAVEQYFDAEPNDRAEHVLACIVRAQKTAPPRVRVKGLKVFYDGALGSEGALLSCAYCGSGEHGLRLMTPPRLREIALQTWEKGLDLAVHAIGDEANHQVAQVAAQLWQEGYRGWLHIEHAQMMRPETIALLKGHTVRCHMQPCHWLSDKRWLKDKVGKLWPYCFPWRALEEAGVAFDFGSDSPIEEASLLATQEALIDSAHAGIATLQKSAWHYHQHPDSDWVPQCFSQWSDAKLQAVSFSGQFISI